MRRDLAERLLAKIMGWTDEDKATECAYLEAFANYKYDEYQQYRPGRRFLESLALWLRQFKPGDERQIAYKFVHDRVVFISEAEMNHLVELAFPTFLRPHLVELTAQELKIPSFRVRKIIDSTSYKEHQRRVLFLGLSDGARTGQFRRANWRDVTNEQIWHAYDISPDKAEDLKQELGKDIADMNEDECADNSQVNSFFETVVLLDDFTASGTSFLREEGKSDWKGKIHKVLDMLETDKDGLGSLVCWPKVKVIVILYVAAPQAIDYLRPLLDERGSACGGIELHVVHRLGQEQKLALPQDKGILSLVENDENWDESADDKHTKVGGKSCRAGYAGCALPVILSHNTPNNSIFLLWAEERRKIQGLFPRVSRHRTFG